MFEKIKLKYIKKRFSLIKDEFNYYKIKKIGIDCNKNFIKTLFLGSSHGEFGINTNMVENLEAYNLCLGSQDLYYSYELYKKYADYCPNLKNVCITYSVFSSGYELQKTINRRLAYYYKKVFNIDFKYHPEFGLLEKELEILDNISVQKVSKGFTGYKEHEINFNYNKAVNELKSHLKNAFRNNGQEKFIELFYNLAQKKNHNLYIIIPPHSPEYQKQILSIAKDLNYDPQKIFEPLYSINKNLTILNYFNNKNFTDNDFYDWEHLLASGAIKFTNFLINDIIDKNKEIKNNENTYPSSN